VGLETVSQGGENLLCSVAGERAFGLENEFTERKHSTFLNQRHMAAILRDLSRFIANYADYIGRI